MAYIYVLAVMLMNTFILSILLLLLSNLYCTDGKEVANQTYFEGSITYKGDFVKKTDKYDSTTLALIAGLTTTLFVKDGKYLTVVESGITTQLLYRKDENTFYRQRFNSDTVYYTRANQPGQKILRFTKTPKVERILGIDCDELKVYYENKTVTYYYNSDTLRSNPDWFKNTTGYNENFYSQEMKAVNLKSVIEYKDFIVTQTATEIKSRKLDNKLFDIPEKPMIEDK